MNTDKNYSPLRYNIHIIPHPNVQLMYSLTIHNIRLMILFIFVQCFSISVNFYSVHIICYLAGQIDLKSETRIIRCRIDWRTRCDRKKAYDHHISNQAKFLYLLYISILSSLQTVKHPTHHFLYIDHYQNHYKKKIEI